MACKRSGVQVPYPPFQKTRKTRRKAHFHRLCPGFFVFAANPREQRLYPEGIFTIGH